MTKEFIYLSTFEKRWKELNLGDTELVELEEELLRNPMKGDVIPGTNGLRKLRFSLRNKGKRGGARVIYLNVLFGERIYMFFAYGKNEKADLTIEERRNLGKIVKEIKNIEK